MPGKRRAVLLLQAGFDGHAPLGPALAPQRGGGVNGRFARARGGLTPRRY